MQRWITLTVAGFAGLSLLADSGCGDGGGKGGSGPGAGASRLNGAGSSFVKPMMDEWAKAYRTDRGVEINYQSKGSSTGIEQTTDQAIDFGCSDAPMNEEQLKRAEARGGKVVHVPLVMGAVVP